MGCTRHQSKGRCLSAAVRTPPPPEHCLGSTEKCSVTGMEIWLSRLRAVDQRRQGPCPELHSIHRRNASTQASVPHSLYLAPTHLGDSAVNFSCEGSSLSAPASSSSELESTASSLRLGFLLRRLFLRPVMMRPSGSLAVPSWESEGKPDRPPQGMGEVHRRGGTSSCGESQAQS